MIGSVFRVAANAPIPAIINATIMIEITIFFLDGL
jgi:hypothetical protein